MKRDFDEHVYLPTAGNPERAIGTMTKRPMPGGTASPGGGSIDMQEKP